jgi:hypothetical protein
LKPEAFFAASNVFPLCARLLPGSIFFNNLTITKSLPEGFINYKQHPYKTSTSTLSPEKKLFKLQSLTGKSANCEVKCSSARNPGALDEEIAVRIAERIIFASQNSI